MIWAEDQEYPWICCHLGRDPRGLEASCFLKPSAIHLSRDAAD